MRALVCGGRDFTDYMLMLRELDKLDIHLVIAGGARGADTLAKRYADEREINFLCFPANWEKFGRSAGPIRNKQMLSEGRPDLVVAFPGARGTADMVKRAKEACVCVVEIQSTHPVQDRET